MPPRRSKVDLHPRDAGLEPKARDLRLDAKHHRKAIERVVKHLHPRRRDVKLRHRTGVRPRRRKAVAKVVKPRRRTDGSSLRPPPPKDGSNLPPPGAPGTARPHPPPPSAPPATSTPARVRGRTVKKYGKRHRRHQNRRNSRAHGVSSLS